MKELSRLHELNLNIVSESYKDIMSVCNTHPDIAEFVRLICLSDDWYNIDNPESIIGNELMMFAYQLGYDIQINPYHSSSLLYNLDYFIGNFLLDDSYFEMKKEKKLCDQWVAYSSEEYGSTQDPKVLIECAKDNIKWRDECMTNFKRRMKMGKCENCKYKIENISDNWCQLFYTKLKECNRFVEGKE